MLPFARARQGEPTAAFFAHFASGLRSVQNPLRVSPRRPGRVLTNVVFAAEFKPTRPRAAACTCRAHVGAMVQSSSVICERALRRGLKLQGSGGAITPPPQWPRHRGGAIGVHLDMPLWGASFEWPIACARINVWREGRRPGSGFAVSSAWVCAAVEDERGLHGEVHRHQRKTSSEDMLLFHLPCMAAVVLNVATVISGASSCTSPFAPAQSLSDLRGAASLMKERIDAAKLAVRGAQPLPPTDTRTLAGNTVPERDAGPAR
ncbi:hypothetical protein VTO73DRAFT_4677 [Trametes versicolor]